MLWRLSILRQYSHSIKNKSCLKPFPTNSQTPFSCSWRIGLQSLEFAQSALMSTSSSSSPAPCIGIISAGAMGSAVASRLTHAGCTILTDLTGRSSATRKRAEEAGMQDAPLSQIAQRADWVLSILPPSDAFGFAQHFLAEANRGVRSSSNPLVFVDCNAVNAETVKKIKRLFVESSFPFVDACIIGGPPTAEYDPKFYASVDEEDKAALDEFEKISKYGLKVMPLRSEGANVGDASSLKMSYAGISKGITGLLTTMILAANASSPATADALLHELHSSQPVILNRIVKTVPPMLPKAYRWIGEMEEIAGFVGEGEGDIYHGVAKLYERIEKSLKEGKEGGDIVVLNKFVEDAKQILG